MSPIIIYLNMCAKFGYGPTVVSKKRGGVQTDRQRKLQLYIVDIGDRACVGITIRTNILPTTLDNCSKSLEDPHFIVLYNVHGLHCQ